MLQRTLVLLKPDAYARGLLGSLTAQFESRGLWIVGCKLVRFDEPLLKSHYAHLVDKDFFPGIADFMTSQPVMVQCWEGNSAVEIVRSLIGPTNGREAEPGTVRGNHSLSIQCNLIHASDSVASAEEEMARFFAPGELHEVTHPLAEYFYAPYEM